MNFPSLDRDAAGSPVTISALTFARRGQRRFRAPAVIALHGCGGMRSARDGRAAAAFRRYGRTLQPLLADGYAVVVPDSFNPRGRREICTIRTGDRSIGAATRRMDVLGALAWSAKQPGVDARRVAVVGWSHGGSTTLATINVRNREVSAFLDAAGAPPFFARRLRSTRAAQGRCGRETVGNPGPRREFTSAKPTTGRRRSRASRSGRRCARAVTICWSRPPGSHHGFDSPGDKVVLRSDVPNGVHPGEGVHVGANPAARAAANEQVRVFLRERLQQ